MVILILCCYKTRNTCVCENFSTCESSDGFKCDHFEVTEAIIRWDGWGDIY